MITKTHITTEAHVVSLVDHFYAKAIKDDTIGFIFHEHMEKSLEEHLPIIYSFWQSVLLGTMTYRGQVMAAHIQLNRKVGLTAAHFDRWLALWLASVDALFVGPKAEEAKQRAQAMKDLMLFKLGNSESKGFIQ